MPSHYKIFAKFFEQSPLVSPFPPVIQTVSPMPSCIQIPCLICIRLYPYPVCVSRFKTIAQAQRYPDSGFNLYPAVSSCICIQLCPCPVCVPSCIQIQNHRPFQLYPENETYAVSDSSHVQSLVYRSLVPLPRFQQQSEDRD
jgi:hypothetical protein